MDQPLTLLIVALAIATGLSLAFVRWRNLRRRARYGGHLPGKPSAAQTPTNTKSSDAGLPSAQELSDVEDSPVSLRSLWIGLAGLALAGFGQYSLASGRPELAALGYIAGGGLFAGALWKTAPHSFAYAKHSTMAAPPASAPVIAAAPASGSIAPAVPSPALTPAKASDAPTAQLASPAAPAVNISLPGGLGSFTQNWRYYTIADIIYGRQPRLPESWQAALAVPPPVVLPASLAPAAPVSDEESAVEAVKPHPSDPVGNVEHVSSTPGGSSLPVEILGRFAQPAGLAVAADGQVFVLDAARRMLSVMDASGHLLGESELDIDQIGPAVQLTLAPDGRHLYIVDMSLGRVLRLAIGPANP